MNLQGTAMDIVNVCTVGLMLSSAALFAGNAVYDYKFGKKTMRYDMPTAESLYDYLTLPYEQLHLEVES